MHSAAGPRPAEVRDNFAAVEVVRDFAFGFTLVEKGRVDFTDDGLLFFGTGHEHHPVGLEAFVFAEFQCALGLAGLIDEHPAQSVAG